MKLLFEGNEGRTLKATGLTASKKIRRVRQQRIGGLSKLDTGFVSLSARPLGRAEKLSHQRHLCSRPRGRSIIPPRVTANIEGEKRLQDPAGLAQ